MENSSQPIEFDPKRVNASLETIEYKRSTSFLFLRYFAGLIFLYIMADSEPEYMPISLFFGVIIFVMAVYSMRTPYFSVKKDKTFTFYGASPLAYKKFALHDIDTVYTEYPKGLGLPIGKYRINFKGRNYFYFGFFLESGDNRDDLKAVESVLEFVFGNRFKCLD
jgi:hypothetical protein